MAESMPRSEKVLLGSLFAVAAVVAMLNADPPAEAQPASQTTTVDGVDYPICEQEDCSDQPDQIGVWINPAGQRWLSVGEYSLLIEP